MHQIMVEFAQDGHFNVKYIYDYMQTYWQTWKYNT